MKNLWRLKWDESKWPYHRPSYEWMKKQPIWHDSDMVIALFFGAFLGFLIGVLV